MSVTNEYKEALCVNGKDGALAAQVFIGSPAQKGGMRPGDYIISVDGHKVKDVDQVQREVGRLEAGKIVDFVVIRDSAELTLKVKIEERTEKVSSDNGKLWPGFVASPITEEIKKQFELDIDKGVVVANVLAKSPASALRLQQGDVITAVNGKTVKNLKEFYAELSKVEKSVNFDVYSNGGTITTGTYKF